MARDPDCDAAVDKTTATETAEIKGQTYCFSRKGCRMDLEDSPNAWVMASSEC